MDLKLNIHEAKTHLSYYLPRLLKGDKIVLCRRNVPVAEIRPVSSQKKKKRAIGLAKGKIKIPSSFFEPLPESVLRSFEDS